MDNFQWEARVLRFQVFPFMKVGKREHQVNRPIKDEFGL